MFVVVVCVCNVVCVCVCVCNVVCVSPTQYTAGHLPAGLPACLCKEHFRITLLMYIVSLLFIRDFVCMLECPLSGDVPDAGIVQWS